MVERFTEDGTSYTTSGIKSLTAVVFIHGLGLNKDMWRYQINEFQKKYCVLSYDLSGHGNSAVSKDDPSLAVFTKQLESLLSALNFSKVILIGFSLGGMIARHFTQTYQSMVKSLVILNSPHKRTSIAQAAVLNRYHQVSESGPSATIDDAIKRWFTIDFEENNKEKIDLVRSWILSNEPKAYSKNYWVLVDGVEEVIDKKGKISCPTLVIAASEDYGNGPEMAQSIVEEIVGAKLVVLTGLRHMALFEQPQTVNRHLDKFLESSYPKE
jgi:pimeloyl-ACP methyl ester carboxylesterase